MRVLATHEPAGAGASRSPVPANARLVDWLSYARTMPHCDAVVCHAGHGTLARALASGAPVVACPAAGDMAENAARVRWAGAGVSLPRRLHDARGVRLAVRRVLGDPRYAAPCRGAARLGAPQRRGQRGRRRSRRVRRISQNSAKSGLIALRGLTRTPTAGLLILETRTERRERSHEVVRLAPMKVNFG